MDCGLHLLRRGGSDLPSRSRSPRALAAARRACAEGFIAFFMLIKGDASLKSLGKFKRCRSVQGNHGYPSLALAVFLSVESLPQTSRDTVPPALLSQPGSGDGAPGFCPAGWQKVVLPDSFPWHTKQEGQSLVLELGPRKARRESGLADGTWVADASARNSCGRWRPQLVGKCCFSLGFGEKKKKTSFIVLLENPSKTDFCSHSLFLLSDCRKKKNVDLPRFSFFFGRSLHRAELPLQHFLLKRRLMECF